MEIIKYQLRISLVDEEFENLSNILGLEINKTLRGWYYEIKWEDRAPNHNIIEEFLNALDGKMDKLSKIGVKKEHISIWIIYGYHNKCNMEFSPETMERMGKNGITFCISCFEAGE